MSTIAKYFDPEEGRWRRLFVFVGVNGANRIDPQRCMRAAQRTEKILNKVEAEDQLDGVFWTGLHRNGDVVTMRSFPAITTIVHRYSVCANCSKILLSSALCVALRAKQLWWTSCMKRERKTNPIRTLCLIILSLGEVTSFTRMCHGVGWGRDLRGTATHLRILSPSQHSTVGKNPAKHLKRNLSVVSGALLTTLPISNYHWRNKSQRQVGSPMSFHTRLFHSIPT